MALPFELFAQEPGLDQYRVSNTDTETPTDKAHASSYRPPWWSMGTWLMHGEVGHASKIVFNSLCAHRRQGECETGTWRGPIDGIERWSTDKRETI